MSASLRAWVPTRIADENSDITEYVGFAELTGRLALRELPPWLGGNLGLDATVRKGTGGVSRGSVQIGLTVQPWGRTRWATPHLYVQLFHGHGERLQRYDAVQTAIRAGFELRPR